MEFIELFQTARILSVVKINPVCQTASGTSPTRLPSTHIDGEARRLGAAQLLSRLAMDEFQLLGLVRTLTGVGILCFLFSISFQLEWIFIGWMTGFLVALIFQRLVSLKKILVVKPNSQIYRSIAALLTIDIATLIYFKIDIVMLRHIGESLNEVGFYAAASRILEGVILILFPIANVFFRELRLHANRPEKFIQLTIKLVFYAGALSLFIVPLGIFLGDDIIN